jgi:hypothetical protein
MNEVQTSSVTGERSAERSDSFIDDDADFVKLFVGQVHILLEWQPCYAGNAAMVTFKDPM